MLASAVCGGAAVRRSVVSGVRWMALRPTAASWAAESGGGAEPDLQPEETPVNVTFGQISAAAYRIKSGVKQTAMVHSQRLSKATGVNLYFKHEFTLPTGSFKERGALNALLSLDPEQKKIGVVAASAGNHAQALAYHASRLNIPCTVVMPIIAPFMKVFNCRELGANVVVEGKHLLESREVAGALADSTGQEYINGYDHPDIIAGAGTCGIELLNDVDENVDAVIVPIGGGGLIAGIARAVKTLKPDTLVVGVEPAVLPKASAALAAGRPVPVPPNQTLADGLFVTQLGTNAFGLIERFVDKIVQVNERSISLAILRLVESEKIIVEGGGASGFAALLEGLLPELQGKNVVVPLCGGNIDSPILGRVLERGLHADGRLFQVKVTISDRPGGIARLTSFIAEYATIRDIVHERAWLEHNVSQVSVTAVLEVTTRQDGANLLDALTDAGYKQVDHNLKRKVAY